MDRRYDGMGNASHFFCPIARDVGLSVYGNEVSGAQSVEMNSAVVSQGSFRVQNIRETGGFEQRGSRLLMILVGHGWCSRLGEQRGNAREKTTLRLHKGCGFKTIIVRPRSDRTILKKPLATS